ncbi:unnamed protein product, partial [Rangifer tarandus platyrhynchus]
QRGPGERLISRSYISSLAICKITYTKSQVFVEATARPLPDWTTFTKHVQAPAKTNVKPVKGKELGSFAAFGAYVGQLRHCTSLQLSSLW